MRRPLIVANWKMYKNPAEAAAFLVKLLPLVERSTHCDVVIAPPLVDLAAAVEACRGTRIEVGAQNLFWEPEGAFTGEVSGPMLHAAGCRWAIVGHSERRQYFGETDESVLRKTRAAIDAGLLPIVCVGEMLAEREAGRTEAVLEKQFRDGVSGLTAEQFASVAIAYEPVWAIGTGRTATPEMAADAHRLLRSLAARGFGKDAAAGLRILYGGSVKPDNIRPLMAQPEIDGALVGGASLDRVSFASIVNF